MNKQQQWEQQLTRYQEFANNPDQCTDVRPLFRDGWRHGVAYALTEVQPLIDMLCVPVQQYQVAIEALAKIRAMEGAAAKSADEAIKDILLLDQQAQQTEPPPKT